jgi:hypothetical protein
MRTILAVICSFTVLATGFLSLSLVLLRPPRANYQEWFLMAALFIAQSLFTLVAITGALSGRWTRWLLLIGGVAIIWVGTSWARGTMSGRHFEGSALVLGSVLVVQGVLTLHRLVKQEFVIQA